VLAHYEEQTEDEGVAEDEGTAAEDCGPSTTLSEYNACGGFSVPMGDFPTRWSLVRNLPEGGQAHTFVVRRADGADAREYVLKRLKNPKREDYFKREIHACMSLDHPNVLRVLDRGQTPKGKPFLITEYCPGGSLERQPDIAGVGPRLRFFEQIVAGIAHGHSQEHPIYHLDLKPQNILMKSGTPVVGDWGICFIEDGQVSMTSDGPRGSMYYCAPELRGPKISGDPRLSAADVYSLGKVLYFIFSGEVYDGHEEDYCNDPGKSLANLFPSHLQIALVDDLVSKTVRRNPSERIANGVELLARVQRTAERIEAGGRVLDLRIAQRCLYCGEGRYLPAHDRVYTRGYSVNPKFPPIEERRKPDDQSSPERSRYATMRDVAAGALGVNRIGIPLLLICDHCGNLQYFRLDMGQDGQGENWRP
jgi:serine/threonine protein kinase